MPVFMLTLILTASTMFSALLTLASEITPRESVDLTKSFAVHGVSPGDVLNIRLEPDPNAIIIGLIPPHGRGIQPTGETVLYHQSPWYRIVYRGMSGWVSSRYLIEDWDRYAVSGINPGSKLPIRERPENKAFEIAELPHDAVGLLATGLVDRSQPNNGWREIQYKEIIGWVEEKYLVSQ